MFKKLLFVLVLVAPIATAQYNTAWNNVEARAVADMLSSGATFQVWDATTPPATPDSTVTGTLCADGAVTGSDVTVNTTTSLLTVAGLSDPAINATCTPDLLRIIDDSGARLQLTVRMAANTSVTAQVVITDTVSASATELLQNRPFNITFSLQY